MNQIISSSQNVRDPPSILSYARIQRNWNDRKLEILVSGALTVAFALTVGGIMLFSPASVIAASVVGAVGIATLGYCVFSILRTPKPLPQNQNQHRVWNRFVPLILGTGVMLLPEFRIGALVGAVGLGLNRMIVNGIDCIYPQFKKKYHVVSKSNDEMEKIEREQFFTDSIIGPIAEEIVCRGFLQKIISTIAGEQLGIIGSSFLFGYFHKGNKISSYDKILQCVSCGLKGLPWGWLNNQYGLIAPIAAHMFNNTLNNWEMIIDAWSNK